MVNQVAEQGNYWVANNIIWGLLLVPISALAEIIKKELRGKATLKNMKYYNIIIIVVFLMWLCFIPLLNPFLKYVMGIENLAYYPIVYGLVLKGVFVPDMTFICMMFGFGMVTHLGCSVICLLIYNRRLEKNENGRNTVKVSPVFQR